MRLTTTNQHFDVRGEIIKIGRAPECLVQISPDLGASVSRVHCEILIADGAISVRDPGSRTGTFLNGKRLDAPHPLTKGDLIMLGSGGPTFAIEDLHIVKGAQSPPGGSAPPHAEAEPATEAAAPAQHKPPKPYVPQAAARQAAPQVAPP